MPILIGPPIINFDPTSMLIHSVTGEVTSTTLTVTNNGVMQLDWAASTLVDMHESSSNVLKSFSAPIYMYIPNSAFDGQYLYWMQLGILYVQDPLTGETVDTIDLYNRVLGYAGWDLIGHDGQYFWFDSVIPSPEDEEKNYHVLKAVDLELGVEVKSREVDHAVFDTVSGTTSTPLWGGGECKTLGGTCAPVVKYDREVVPDHELYEPWPP